MRRFLSSSAKPVVVAASRTPIGIFRGTLSPFSAVQLGAIAVKDVLRKANVRPEQIDEAYLGNVVSANVGQAPATQVTLSAGLPTSLPTTTVNKVCSSGMKTIMLGAMTIQQGLGSCVLAGGFESMSNIPYYVPKGRSGYGYGHGELLDGVLRDGLHDAFDNLHMGVCAEYCAAEYKISREEQDAYAIESFRRAQEATDAGHFKDDIVAVSVKAKGLETTLKEDENIRKLNKDKVPTLRSPFKKDGSVTAANSSSLNDGAAAVIVSSEEFAVKNGLKPIARILGFADAQRKPIEFPVAPALAIPKALANAGLTIGQIDLFEINEAFANVAIANAKMLNIDFGKLNILGGAVALGHPIGASGARIVQTLITALRIKGGRYGCAAICNGGGGASAIVVERL